MPAWKWNSLTQSTAHGKSVEKVWKLKRISSTFFFFLQLVNLSILPPSVTCDSHHSLKYKKKRKQSCGLHQITVLGTVHKGSSHKKASRLHRLSLCGDGSFHCQPAQRHDMQATLVLERPGGWRKKCQKLFLGTLGSNKTQLLQRRRANIFLPLLLFYHCVLHFYNREVVKDPMHSNEVLEWNGREKLCITVSIFSKTKSLTSLRYSFLVLFGFRCIKAVIGRPMSWWYCCKIQRVINISSICQMYFLTITF